MLRFGAELLLPTLLGLLEPLGLLELLGLLEFLELLGLPVCLSAPKLR